MTGKNPDFKQPPWVYGPKETMEWIDATNPSKKSTKKTEKKSKNNFLSNIHIQLDIDAEKTRIAPPTIFSKLISKITGNNYVEEHFDLLSTAEVILRALVKAKFRRTVKILIDKKIKHDHPEITSDLKKAVDILEGISIDEKACKIIEISALSEDGHKCCINIKIKKVHKEKEHAIDITFERMIKEDVYHIFLNYLNENLKIKEVTSK